MKLQAGQLTNGGLWISLGNSQFGAISLIEEFGSLCTLSIVIMNSKFSLDYTLITMGSTDVVAVASAANAASARMALDTIGDRTMISLFMIQ